MWKMVFMCGKIKLFFGVICVGWLVFVIGEVRICLFLVWKNC